MKKNMLTVALVFCAMVMFTGCPEPANVPSETNEQTVTTPDGITVAVPIVTLPNLPASVGEDPFAGKTFRHETEYVDGSISYDDFIFASDGTVNRTQLGSTYEYSYDGTKLYMRYKYLRWEDPVTGVIKEQATPQEYINLSSAYLAEHFYEDTSKEEMQKAYNDNKAECDEWSGGSTFEDYVEFYLQMHIKGSARMVGRLYEYTYTENSFTLGGGGYIYTLVEN
ncbi:MAG: hypothetical protein SPI86_02785 [Treponemataceae bacterium]|nr:hypothetical protein [Spirochaetales bacterium]MDY6030669.1 hypothetical protein [Treponemataceae bacterium]